MSTFARINTQDVPAPRDFTDFWKEPTSSFLASGMCKAASGPADVLFSPCSGRSLAAQVRWSRRRSRTWSGELAPVA